MTAEVIVLPNQNNTEMLRQAEPEPAGLDADRAYVLDLEQENLDLRSALAEAELRAMRGTRDCRRTAAVCGLVLAFVAGWLLDPPWHDAKAQARASEGFATESSTHAPSAEWGHSAPPLRPETTPYELPV